MGRRLNTLEMTSPYPISRVANAIPRRSLGGLLDRKVIWNGNEFLPPSLGCVLYLPGYPGQGVSIKDYSGSGNHGTITGATWLRLPSGLPVLSFDGDDKVVVPHHASLNFGATDSFYIKVWLKGTVTSGQYVVVKSGGNPFYYLYINYVTAGKIAFRISDGTFAPAIEGNTLVCNGVWHQVWGVRDVVADVLRIFVDGASDKTAVTDTATGAINPTGDLGIGSSAAGGSYFFGTPNALLEIGLGAPTQAEITNSFNREKHLFGV